MDRAITEAWPGWEFDLADRTYTREGNVVRCYAVLKGVRRRFIDKREIVRGKLIWVLPLPTEQDANNLLEDLYYGEYTGG